MPKITRQDGKWSNAAEDPIEIAKYDSAWPEMFTSEAAAIRDALCDVSDLTVEHIGSTAVPGLAAKPVIDVMIVVPDRFLWTALIRPLEGLQEEHRGDRRGCHQHAEPGPRELGEAADEPGCGGHRAPHGEADRDDRAPRASVGEARDRDAGEGVEEREGDAGEEAHRGVGDAEVGFDRLDQDREDLAVDEIEDESVAPRASRSQPVGASADGSLSAGAGTLPWAMYRSSVVFRSRPII
jgi:hypothetical protein